MTALETLEAIPQTPDGQNKDARKPWPAELEICIEYCTRKPFHGRYDPQKYSGYFEGARDAFLRRSPHTRIIGNPWTTQTRTVRNLCTGRRPLRACDELGMPTEDVELPRLGSFEVTVNSTSTGQVTIFSKLSSRRWPNLRLLVHQVDRLIDGLPLLEPAHVQSQSPMQRSMALRALKEKRLPRQLDHRMECQVRSPKATAPNESWPRSPRTSPRTKTAPATPSSPSASSRRSPGSHANGFFAKTSSPTSSPTRPATGDPAAINTQPSPTSSSAFIAAHQSATNTQELRGHDDANLTSRALGYDELPDEFEADESGSGLEESFGPRVWMPQDAKEESWEEEERSHPQDLIGSVRNEFPEHAEIYVPKVMPVYEGDQPEPEVDGSVIVGNGDHINIGKQTFTWKALVPCHVWTTYEGHGVRTGVELAEGQIFQVVEMGTFEGCHHYGRIEHTRGWVFLYDDMGGRWCEQIN